MMSLSPSTTTAQERPAGGNPAPEVAGPRAGDTVDLVETVIRPRHGWIGVNWRELWRYRELLYFLVWRDLKVRYKQALLGFAWAVLAPLIQVAIFTIVFGQAGGFSDRVPAGIPYSVYIFAGLIPWLMIAQSISTGGLSLVNQQALLTKVYMPRLFIPASVIGSALADMLIAYAVFSVMMLVAGVAPAWTVLALPLLIGVNLVMSLGFALTLSSLTITFRDLRFLIPFVVQLLMLVSAVAYPSSVLKAWPALLYLNPIAGLLDAFRALTFEGKAIDWGHLAYATAFAGAIFAFGLFHFRRTERRFADIA